MQRGELWFAATPGGDRPVLDFFDTDEIAGRLAAFEQRYNSLAEPFDWRFGRDDLAKFLARL